MPAPVLTVTVMLARLGDLLAFAGFVVGLCFWQVLTADRKGVAVFLGLSAALGGGQAVLKAHGIPTAVMGNLWDLSILALLIPALLEVTRRSMRNGIRPFLMLALLGWCCIFLLGEELPAYNDAASLGFYALLAVSASMVLSQFVEDGRDPWRKDAFVLALACLAGALFDVVTSVAFLHPRTAGELLRVLMAMRNTVWCFSYGLMIYSLTLKRRPRRTPEPEQARPAERFPFFHLKEAGR